MAHVAASDGDLQRNRLLHALPSALRAELRQRGSVVPLVLGQVLYEPGQPISHVYFPLTAVLSLLTLLQDGGAVEAAMVGNDGMVGLPVFLELEADTNQALVQAAGEALKLPAAD